MLQFWHFPHFRMKKLLPFLALCTLLTACSSNQANVIPNPPSDTTGTQQPAPDPMNQSRVIDMSVSNFQFTPAVITLRKGENIVLRLVATSGTHTFTSAALGLDIAISEGETKGFNIPTENAGIFEFHSTSNPAMTGQIVIE